MFHTIPQPILERMQYLEKKDQRDRQDGTPTKKRLRQIPPQTGRFIALMASIVPAGQIIEIGTSGGYSTLWMSVASRDADRHITTFEILPEKVTLARETFKQAGVTDMIDLVSGDALKFLSEYKKIAFCFLDAEKEVYQQCYDIVVPNMIPGGILVADNVISHETILKPMVEHALADERVDAMVVPIGSGVLLCIKQN
jgi:caffeoyl-CoA O-methyltransferase